MRLTKTSIEELAPRSETRQYQDHLVSGLWLVVQPSGEKIWYLYLPHHPKEIAFSIGSYSDIDLRSARKIAREQMKGSLDDIGFYTSSYDKLPLLSEQKRVKLSQVMNEHKNVKFRPNPLFQDRKRATKRVADLRLKEKEQRKFYRQKQEEIEIEMAWNAFQQTKNLAILSKLLRSENVRNNPLPVKMLKEIAYFLDLVTPQAQKAGNVDDERVFMTYWRHTEFKNGVEPLLMDLGAVSECVVFMEVIGRPLPFENIESRLKLGYATWRKNNDDKLEKSAKVLREMIIQPEENQNGGDELNG